MDMRRGSWTWNSITECKEALVKGVCFIPGSNSQLHIWTDPWIPDLSEFKQPNNLREGCTVNWVKELIDPSGTGWNLSLINNIFPRDIVDAINKCKIPLDKESDSLIWTPTATGSFSIRSAYLENNKERFQLGSSVPKKMWQQLWQSNLHSRHKHLIWRLLSNILPTKGRRSSIFQLDDDQCFLFLCGQKTTHHLLMECPCMKLIWWNSKWNFRIDSFANLTIEEWIGDLLGTSHHLNLDAENKGEILCFTAVAFEQIWMIRNKVRLGDDIPDWQNVSSNINLIHGTYWRASMKKKLARTHHVHRIVWEPPPTDWIKINFDASFTDNYCTRACIMRDHLGNPLEAWIDSSLAESPFEAEAGAAIQALKWADAEDIKFVVFEGDALFVILALNGSKQHEEWRGRNLILEGRNLLNNHPTWRMKHVPREDNMAAHNLADWGKSGNQFGYIHPSLLPPAALCDRGGTQSTVCNSFDADEANEYN